VILELSSWHAILEHLLNFDNGASFHLRKAEEQVQTDWKRGSKEDECYLAAQVCLVGIEEVGQELVDSA